MVFSNDILGILKLTEWLSMSVIRHTTKGSIWHRLEISVSSEWSVMLMYFLVSMSLTPNFITIGRLRNDVLYCVSVNHFNYYI